MQKSRKWLTAREIQEKAKNISLGSVQCNIKKLIKHKLAEAKPSKKLTKKGIAMPVNKYRPKKTK